MIKSDFFTYILKLVVKRLDKDGRLAFIKLIETLVLLLTKLECFF